VGDTVNATTPPRVSVVIAAYNRAGTIKKTLDSVLAQTCRASEIIVVDDGSSDNTAEWVRTHYPQAKVSRFENGGASVARNRGAAQASGDVIVFLDSDDEMLPHALQTFVDLLQRFPRACAAFADHTFRNLVDGTYWPNHHAHLPSFARMRAIQIRESDGQDRVYGRAMFYALLHGNILQQPWAIYREVFTELGGFDPAIRLCEDWEIYIRVADRVPLAVTDRVIANHFVESGKDHMSLVPGQAAQHMKVLEKHARAARWKDPRAFVIARRRLGLYYKAAGDEARERDAREAWRLYLQSLARWPFDYVVLVRSMVWSLSAFGGRSGRS
jgi:glycosyltransferase involved in cell wall biosynthesis